MLNYDPKEKIPIPAFSLELICNILSFGLTREPPISNNRRRTIESYIDYLGKALRGKYAIIEWGTWKKIVQEGDRVR